MTEIPEHLLNRSKARRAETSGQASSDASPAVPASSTPATPTPSTPAVAPPPKPVEPDPAYVVAAKTRKKIPFWAMSALSLLPLWAFMYLWALTPEDKVVEGPRSIGAAVYSGCAGCHGAAGQGGAGQVLHEGEVMKTFPHIEDMLNFVYVGSQAFVSDGIPTYGNPNREGGAHRPLGYNGNVMPAQGPTAGGGLSEYQILAVACHIRYDLAGADPASEEWAAEYNEWCSPDSEIFAALQSGSANYNNLHEVFAMLEKKPIEVGTKARLGSSK